MGQIAIKRRTGEVIEAFSVSSDEWNEIRREVIGTYLMPQSEWPAVPKVSIRGLRYFAHHPGFEGAKPEPESYAHTRLKIDVAKAARRLGYQADLEEAGTCPKGSQWRADVMVTDHNNAKIAFEVQLSSQTLNEYRLRTERYVASNIRCCWIFPKRKGSTKLTSLEQAIRHENKQFNDESTLIQIADEHLQALSFFMDSKDTYPEELPMLHLHGAIGQNSNKEFDVAILNIIKKKTRWERPYWYWSEI
ncbi:competence protein CoiA family protein [Octadecabacter sp. SW4]|uniref:competence protein CoiA family protein n=1 Tax=Octadecabacter sp. SW4 TaxID=2602067 RepID=UPI00155AF208|nr:competence protein CoiA family protein [Octadecabacter sp. SW4]